MRFIERVCGVAAAALRAIARPIILPGRGGRPARRGPGPLISPLIGLLSLLAGLLVGPLGEAVAAAEPAEHPRGELRLADALAAALRGNPDLQLYPYERRAVEARTLQAGLRPNPELGVDIENFAGSGEYHGASALETTLRLGVLLETAGKRQRRIDAAARGGAVVDADYALQRLDVLAETARRFVDVAESQAQYELAERGVDSAQAVLDATDRAVRIGRLSSFERNRARIALARATLEREHYEHLLRTQKRSLAALWGEREAEFTAVRADLYALPEVADYAVLRERLRDGAEAQRYAAEAGLRDAEVALARAKARPDPLLSAGLRHLDRSDDTALVAYLQLPLPFRDRNQGAIAEAQARRQRVDVAAHAAQVRADAVLYDLVQELGHARTVLEALRGELIPQADEALLLARRGYENGRFGYLDLADAQRTRLELEREAVANAAEYHRYFAAIERMTAAVADSATSSLPVSVNAVSALSVPFAGARP